MRSMAIMALTILFVGCNVDNSVNKKADNTIPAAPRAPETIPPVPLPERGNDVVPIPPQTNPLPEGNDHLMPPSQPNDKVMLTSPADVHPTTSAPNTIDHP